MALITDNIAYPVVTSLISTDEIVVIVAGALKKIAKSNFTSTADVSTGAMDYVDPTYGSPSGERGKLTSPFQTLAQAKTAALSGDTIIVYPGTYAETGLWKAGVNWRFMPGVVIAMGTTTPVFDDTAGAGVCIITGAARFTASVANSCAFRLTHGSTLNLVCDTLTGEVTLTGGGPHYLKFDAYTDPNGAKFVTKNCDSSFYFDYCYGSFYHNFGSGTTGVQVVYGSRIIANPCIVGAGTQYIHVFDTGSVGAAASFGLQCNGGLQLAKIGTTAPVICTGGVQRIEATGILKSDTNAPVVFSGGSSLIKGATIGSQAGEISGKAILMSNSGTLTLKNCRVAAIGDVGNPGYCVDWSGTPELRADGVQFIADAGLTDCMLATGGQILRVYAPCVANLQLPVGATKLGGALDIGTDYL